MHCPMCGAKNPDYARFCARCGASLEGSLDQHGSEQAGLSRLASNRGTRPDTGCTGPDARPQMCAAASSDQLPSSPPRRSRKGIAIVTVLVAVLAAVVTFCALRLRSTPSTVAVFPSGDESDGGSYYTAEGNLLCGIRLAADRTHAYVGDEDGSVTLTLHYVGKDNYVLGGTGIVHGRVLWQNVDDRGNAIAGEEPEPVASAHVRAYRLLNRKFVALDDNEAVSAADGTFTIPELPMGNLVLLAEMDGKNKTEQAKLVGKAIAERAKEKGITSVVFDRGGFRYFGRVKALAEAAREAGLEF